MKQGDNWVQAVSNDVFGSSKSSTKPEHRPGSGKEVAVEAVNLTVAMTGASGAVFGRELLRALEADERVSARSLCRIGKFAARDG